MTGSPKRVPETKSGSLSALVDRTEEYRSCDVASLGWQASGKARFGGVVFDEDVRILLREPSNHFDGYHWTFSKGNPDAGEHPVDAALREVLEETGYRPQIVRHLRDGFGGTGSVNYYFLMLHRLASDALVVPHGWETTSLRWVDEAQARQLIAQTTNTGGRERDLATLDAACSEIARMLS